MIPRGTVVGYKATVTINPCQLSCQTTFPHPVKAFSQAMTSKLETCGLLLLNYNVKKVMGRNQFYCQFSLQTMNGFPSKQAIVAVVSANIVQETGHPAQNPQDPPVLCDQTYCICTGTQQTGIASCSGAFTSPRPSGSGYCAKPWCCQLSPWQKFTSFWHNAIYGTLSTCQKGAVASQSAGELVNAGVNPSSAVAQANANTTAQLTANNADPSQSCLWNSAGLQKVLPYIYLAFGLLIAVVVLQFAGLWKTARA